MIIATELNFEAEVLPASLTTPVLVDFWAPWCTPCKTLIPVLEKLEAEYEGRFILAKVNVDEQPGLAAMFGVRSVPACMLLKEGRTIDGFMGALPEVQVREFLDKHLQPAAPAAQPELADDVLDDEEILERLQNVLAAEPENDNARFDYVKLLLQLGRMEEAQAAFVPAAAKMAAVRKFDSLHRWLQALQAQQQAPADMAALDAAIAANLVMTAVRPHMCGIGGDLFAIVWDPKTGKLYGLNASGRAPLGRSYEAMKAKTGGGKIPGFGSLSVTVPGKCRCSSDLP